MRQASDAVASYLEPATRRPLILAIEQRLLAPHVTALIEKGFDALMDENRCVAVGLRNAGGGAGT